MGANDPIRTTTEPMSDAIVAAVTQSWALSLADRSGGGLLANPVLQAGFRGSARLGALGTKRVWVGFGADKLSTATEGNDATVITVASDAATVTPARKALARQVSDMARMFDSWGITEWANFSRDSTWAWQQTVVDVLAALFSSLTSGGGATGTAMTYAKLIAARNSLGVANVPGPYVYVCRPKTWGEISTDMLSLGGAVQMDPETLNAKGTPFPGFKGVYDRDIWVYTSNEVDESGVDYVSAIFGQGALEWDSVMPAAPSPGCQPIMWTPLFGVETQRLALKSEDYIVTSSHIGASVGLSAAGKYCLSVIA